MKSLDFKQKTSVIRVLSNDNKQKKINWDRIIYLAFITILIIFLGYYAFIKIFFIKAQGQVSFENIDIRIPEDCRILSYQVAEDDTVKKGDSLFVYSIEKENFNFGGVGFGRMDTFYNSQSSWIDKEIFAIRKKIALNNLEINQNNELLSAFQDEMQEVENMVTLDIMPSSRYEYVKAEIRRLKSELIKIKSENAQNYAYLNQLYAMNKKGVARTSTYAGGYGGGGGEQTRTKVFYSPISGTVTRLYTHQYEVALKQDLIMAIHSDHPMFVKAFFDQEDVAYFQEGDIVDIKFPDGRTSQGVLRRFYYSTIQLPVEFQKRYEPTTRTLAADIYPITENDYALWRGFYKMSVSITKYKY